MPPPRSRPVVDYSSFEELDGDDDDFRIAKTARVDRKQSQDAAVGKRRKTQREQSTVQLSDDLAYEQELQAVLALSMQDNSPTVPAITPASPTTVSNPDPVSNRDVRTSPVPGHDPGEEVTPAAVAGDTSSALSIERSAGVEPPAAREPAALIEPAAKLEPAEEGGHTDGEADRAKRRSEAGSPRENDGGRDGETAEVGAPASGDRGTATPTPPSEPAAMSSSASAPGERQDVAKQPSALASGKNQAKRRSKPKASAETSGDRAASPPPDHPPVASVPAPGKGKSRKKAPSAGKSAQAGQSSPAAESSPADRPGKRKPKPGAKAVSGTEQSVEGSSCPLPRQLAEPTPDANGGTAAPAADAAAALSASRAEAGRGPGDAEARHNTPPKKPKKPKAAKPVGTAHPNVIAQQHAEGDGGQPESAAAASNAKKSASVKPAAAKPRKVPQSAAATPGRGPPASPRCRGVDASPGPAGAAGPTGPLGRSPGGGTLRLGLSRFARIKPLHPTLAPE